MKKNLFLSVSLIALFTLSLIPKSLYAQVTVDENKNVLVGSGSPTSGYKFTVNGHTDIIGLARSKEFLTLNGYGSITMRQKELSPSFRYQELHVRPSSGNSGLISFTEDAVADRWVMGILASNSKLIFSQGSPVSINEHFTIDRQNSITQLKIDNNVLLTGDRKIIFGDGSGTTNFKIMNNSSTDLLTLLESGKVHVDGKFGVNSFSNMVASLSVGGNLKLHGTQPESDLGANLEGGLLVAFQNSTNQTPSNQNPCTRLFFGNGTGYQMHFSKRVNSTTTDLMTIVDDGTIVAGLLKVRPNGKVGINYNFNPILSNFNVYGHFRLGGEQDVATNVGSSVESELIITNEHPVKRFYFGNGTGYSIKFAKRNGGTTTDIFSIADHGEVSGGIFKIAPNGRVGINLGGDTPPSNLSMRGQLFMESASNPESMPTNVGSAMIVKIDGNDKKFFFGDRTSYNLNFTTRKDNIEKNVLQLKDTGEVRVEDGDVYLKAIGKGIIMRQPNGLKCRRITVDNDGHLVVSVEIDCPN